MSNPMSIERMLSDWMADEVARGVADEVVDQILSDTGRRRPARRWLALLQEPPMRLERQVAVGSPTSRLVLTVALILLAFAVAVGVGAAILLRPQPAPADDWPGFRGDASRAGTSARGPIGRPVLAWQYHAGGAVSNDLAIVGDLVLAPSDDGVLHALAIGDGHERWAYRSGSGPMGGPTVADGTLFVADGTGVLSALDLATGQVRWRTAAPLDGPTYAVVGNGSVYVGTSSGSLVALDAQTGVERWRSAVDPSGGKVNIPALAGGRVYVASKGGGFVAVDAATGTIAWRVDTGDAPTGTAVVAGGIAWIGEPAGATRACCRPAEAQGPQRSPWPRGACPAGHTCDQHHENHEQGLVLRARSGLTTEQLIYAGRAPDWLVVPSLEPSSATRAHYAHASGVSSRSPWARWSEGSDRLRSLEPT